MRAFVKFCFVGIEIFGKGLSNCFDEYVFGFININNFGFYMYFLKYIESDLFNYIYIFICNFWIEIYCEIYYEWFFF